MKELTLKRLRNTSLNKLYKKLVLNEPLSQIEYKKLLSIAIILINENNKNIINLGYRIIVMYCNYTKDYKPLYDIALNMGLFPIVKFIEKDKSYSGKFEESFYRLFHSALGENFKNNNYYLSAQQKELFSFFNNNSENSISIIAPTSYGKSELIITLLKEKKDNNVCIVVPTKALITQTKRRLIEADIKNVKKIITHPEMYLEKDENVTAVLTQERLLRLLKKVPELHFDIVFIDEAHNLLEDDERSVLLASAITILEKRSSNTNFKFLTPFLLDSSNLSVRYSKYNPEPYKITEYIKTERLYIYDERKDKVLKFYDQFLDEFFYTEENSFISDIDLIHKKSSSKNIIYLNKPADIEKFSSSFSSTLPDLNSEKIKNACNHLSDFLDPEYQLINCIKSGVIYHHGSVPDNIRIYVEHLYSELEDMKFVITSSTLLEGVNIPASTLFLLDNKKGNGNLSSAQFKNLIGRVCRFNDVFSPVKGNLNKLEPHIYVIGSDYVSKNANLEKFIKDSMKVDKKEKETPSNVLLKNVNITSEKVEKKEKADEFIENFEPGVITNYKDAYAKTEIGRVCFANNITEIDIITNELEMQKIIEQSRKISINSSEKIFEYFSKIFLPHIKESESYNNIRRLYYVEARNFYKMFLNWRIKSASYREMISSFLRYWESIVKEGKDTDVYVGRWGDKIKGNGFRPIWTDISKKNHFERINLAIVRIKEEQDFLDNTFIKYIEVLNDLKLVQQDFYEKIKYGTSDKSKITLIKNGLSLTLTNLLLSGYREFIDINIGLNSIEIDPKIIKKMQDNNENDILIHEVKYNTKIYSK